MAESKGLTIAELLAIVDKKRKPNPEGFWVDVNGTKHSVSGSLGASVAGGFQRMSSGNRRYVHGQALYYKLPSYVGS